MPDVSGDGMAFVVSSTGCSSVSAVTGSSVTSGVPSGGGSLIRVSVNGGGAASGGVYELCVRWSSVSAYFSVGPFAIVTVVSLTPSVIPAVSGTVQWIAVGGAGLVNVSGGGGGGDSSAFVVSSSGCSSSSLSSVVTSVSCVFLSSTSLMLSVVDDGASAGVYELCMRVSATSVYFWSGHNVTIG